MNLWPGKILKHNAAYNSVLKLYPATLEALIQKNMLDYIPEDLSQPWKHSLFEIS